MAKARKPFIVRFIIWLFSIIITLALILGIGCLIVKQKYGVDVFSTISQIKTLKQIVDKKAMFVTLLILNIFNNLIVWAMAFWVELLVSRYSKVSTFSYNHIGEQSVPKQENEVVLDKDDYEIKSKVDMLTEEIEKLNKLKESGAITEEEYKKLKEDLLNKSFL